jgi:hypothetical protein
MQNPHADIDSYIASTATSNYERRRMSVRDRIAKLNGAINQTAGDDKSLGEEVGSPKSAGGSIADRIAKLQLGAGNSIPLPGIGRPAIDAGQNEAGSPKGSVISSRIASLAANVKIQTLSPGSAGYPGSHFSAGERTFSAITTSAVSAGSPGGSDDAGEAVYEDFHGDPGGCGGRADGSLVHVSGCLIGFLSISILFIPLIECFALDH